MTLEDILSDVKEAANSYGVAIRCADVKDLIFPSNLQGIMNRVLAAERNSEAQLVEARTRAEVEQIEAQSRAETIRREAEAEALRVQAEAEAHAYEERVKAADAPERHPALLRLAELQTLRELARNANARLYFDFDRHGLALNESDAKPSSS